MVRGSLLVEVVSPLAQQSFHIQVRVHRLPQSLESRLCSSLTRPYHGYGDPGARLKTLHHPFHKLTLFVSDQAAKFIVPSANTPIDYASNEELYYHTYEHSLPEGWRFPQMFRGDGTR
jgi:hypothetical protein